MRRRQLLAGAAAWAGTAGVARAQPLAADTPAEAFLAPTPYVDSEHPSLRALVAAVAPPTLPVAERARRLHDHVRDTLRFGWDPAFYDQCASEVLAAGTGFCITKGTLFTALLRAAGVPARQRFVDIHAGILEPFIDPGTPYVDHSVTEVWLDGRWCVVDSYIVDLPLARAARERLAASGRALGWGLHADGQSQWHGRGDAFSQWARDGRFVALSRRDHGVFADVGAFYASGLALNRLSWPLRLGFGFFARRANQRIASLREA